VDPERQQVVEAARGDEKSFQILWSAHRDAVYRFACWMLEDRVAAEDVVQDCFIALLEHPGRFDPERASLRAFLLGIARNLCRNRWRRIASEVDFEDNDDIAFEEPGALDGLVSEEENAILNAALGALPPLQREALFLFEYEGLSLEEAAAVAQVNVGTLKSRLYRGRERLKRELARQGVRNGT
jgi:RNA polymerase sigma-70 factor (ECF subfamily)